ncbi:outer membrane protein [Methylovirgula sp. 4M-Z18]|uniref:outer membrane protein n=1 Tax=Methylovirgula sp. 4M-Z18 TaxID=2293567 RepID=UPI0013142448|nr:outer membrane beta-barrel protein [Methylovirgula sp. 4M-Z18]
MIRIGALVAAGLLVGASLGAAWAADILPPAPKLDDGDTDSALAPSSGWYLRGDLGLDASSNARFKLARNPLNNAGAGATFTDRNRSHGQSFLAGLGLGYQYNDWLRFDVTAEMHGDAKLSTKYMLSDPTGRAFGQPAATLLTGAHDAKLSSTVGLANAYFDVLTWHGLTPYIGAGLGLANVRLSHGSDRGTLTGANGVAAPVSFNTLGGTKTNFAWALMTGVSCDLAPNVKLDLSYRYLDIGSAPKGRSSNGLFRVSSAHVGEQDIRLGVRWMLGGDRK